MAAYKYYTIGVFGKTEEEFFALLAENKIDSFCDIRRRRGVRGAHYAFVNSSYLQKKLGGMNIAYHYITGLTPTDEIRGLQKIIDKENKTSITKRESISPEMAGEYKKQILDKFDFNSFFDMLKDAGENRVAFFCVEGNPAACHRSVLAEHLKKKYGFAITHL